MSGGACQKAAQQANDVLAQQAKRDEDCGCGGGCAPAPALGKRNAPRPKKGSNRRGPGCKNADCNACAEQADEVMNAVAGFSDGIPEFSFADVQRARLSAGFRPPNGALEKRDVWAAAGGANAELHERFWELDNVLPVPPEDPPADAPCGVGRVKCGVSGRISRRANAVLLGLADGPLFDAQKAIIDARYEQKAAEFCAGGCGLYGSCDYHASSVEFVFGDGVDDDGNIELFAGFAYFWECCCETNFHDPPLPPGWDPGDLPWDDDPADTEGSGA